VRARAFFPAPSRVVTTIDGQSDDWLFELWIVPSGAPPPTPSP